MTEAQAKDVLDALSGCCEREQNQLLLWFQWLTDKPESKVAIVRCKQCGAQSHRPNVPGEIWHLT